MEIWLAFFLFAAAVFVVGRRVTFFSDVIAEKTGTRTWIGLIALSAATSLPEIAVASSALLLGKIELAAGNIFGSCLFNLVLFALLEAKVNRFYVSVGKTQVRIALLSFFLLVFASLAVVLPERANPELMGQGIFSTLILIFYISVLRYIFKIERKAKDLELRAEARVYRFEHISKKKAFSQFFVFTVLLLILGIGLVLIVDELARITGLGETFAGMTFLGITTSLPEITATLGAVRFKAVDLAVANILGSNLFNISILAAGDVFVSGNLWLMLGPGEGLPLWGAALMTLAVVLALARPPKKLWQGRISVYAPALVLIYLATSSLAYVYLRS